MADVKTYSDEAMLEQAIAAATSVSHIVCKNGLFTAVGEGLPDLRPTYISPGTLIIPTLDFNYRQQFRDAPEQYRFAGGLSRNPINGKYTDVFTIGETHYGATEDHGIYRMTKDSIDDNFTGEPILIELNTGEQISDSVASYISTGRLIILHSVRNSGDGTLDWLNLRHHYSDNDGSTWTTKNVVTTPIEPFRVANPFVGNFIECDNGDIVQTLWTDDDAQTVNKLWIIRSTDGGVTFDTFNLIDSQPTAIEQLTEANIVKLYNGSILAIARIANTGFLKGYISHDNGLTWSSLGTTTFGENVSPIIQDNNSVNLQTLNTGIPKQEIVACYYTNRVDEDHKVWYGLSNKILSNGLSGFDTNQKVILFSTDMGGLSGYGSNVQYNDGYEVHGVVRHEIGVRNSQNLYYESRQIAREVIIPCEDTYSGLDSDIFNADAFVDDSWFNRDFSLKLNVTPLNQTLQQIIFGFRNGSTDFLHLLFLGGTQNRLAFYINVDSVRMDFEASNNYLVNGQNKTLEIRYHAQSGHLSLLGDGEVSNYKHGTVPNPLVNLANLDSGGNPYTVGGNVGWGSDLGFRGFISDIRVRNFF